MTKSHNCEQKTRKCTTKEPAQPTVNSNIEPKTPNDSLHMSHTAHTYHPTNAPKALPWNPNTCAPVFQTAGQLWNHLQ